MQETEIVLDPRIYDLIRQNAIQTVEEALVELITNSIDSYESLEYKEKKIEGHKNILVRTEGKKITVTDNAVGMTFDELKNKILTVGKMTSESTSRGLIGRGAKDISNISDVIFTSTKNGLTSAVLLKNDLSTFILFKNLNNGENDGTIVTMNVLSSYQVYDDDTLSEKLRKNFFLRNILLEKKYNIYVGENLLSYSNPLGTKIVDIEYEVEGYPGHFAHLKLFKSDYIIKNPSSQMELEYGVLVHSEKSVYECGGVFAEDIAYKNDHRWNPSMKYVYGSLKCDSIDDFARDITINGRTKENPSLIFDSSRRGGLNKKHPFVISLFKIPYKWLEIVLDKVNDQFFSNVNIETHTQNIFDAFKIFMNQNLDFSNILYTWGSKKDQDILNYISQSNITKLSIDENFLDIDEETVENILNGDSDNEIIINNEISYEISFTYDIENKKPYQLLFYKDRIDIKINLADDMVDEFLVIEKYYENGEEKYTYDINNNYCILSITNILKDAIIYIQTRNLIMSDSYYTNVNINNMNEILELFKESSNKCSPCFKTICRNLHYSFCESQNE